MDRILQNDTNIEIKMQKPITPTIMYLCTISECPYHVNRMQTTGTTSFVFEIVIAIQNVFEQYTHAW